jgi:hypothetical protein
MKPATLATRPAAASFLGGAKGRLLPASIPFRFFGAAAAFHVAAWIALFLAAPEVPGFRGGTGPVMAAVHLMTLGVFAVTAMGAAIQLLPVATQAPFRALWAARLMFWLVVAGIPLFGLGSFASERKLTVGGATLVVSALMLFGLLLAGNLRRARGMAVVVLHGWGALACLAALLGLGGVLVADLHHGFLGDRLAIARIHMIVAAYGFMGLFALGFSYVLIPMLALSPAPEKRLGVLGFGAAALALLAASAGIALADARLEAAGGGLGLAAIGLHLWLMLRSLRARMRKRLGPAFHLIRVAWLTLVASVVLGLLLSLGIEWPPLPALFGAALLHGWLATFLFGILQRIVPFLASMHASAPGRAPALASSLAPELPLAAHRACHLAALGLLGGGIAADMPALIRCAAAIGTAGAAAFLVFFVAVLHRMESGRAERRRANDG